MKKLPIKTTVIVVILFLIGFAGSKYFSHLRSERNRWQQNYNSLELERDSVNGVAITRELTINELKQTNEKDLMLLKLENININRLLRLSKVGVKSGFKDVPRKWTDTLYLPSNAPFDSAMLGRFLKIESSCVNIGIFEPSGSDTAYVSGSCEMNLTMAVYRGKRVRQHHLFGIPLFRSGPRQPTAKVIADCPDAKIHVTDIEIKR
jgi:hypothetical protein